MSPLADRRGSPARPSIAATTLATFSSQSSTPTPALGPGLADRGTRFGLVELGAAVETGDHPGHTVRDRLLSSMGSTVAALDRSKDLREHPQVPTGTGTRGAAGVCASARQRRSEEQA